MRATILGFLLFSSACSDDLPKIRTDAPEAPAANDPAYSFERLKHWYLVGDGLTPDAGTLELVVTAPSVDFLDAWLVNKTAQTTTAIRLDQLEDGRWYLKREPADLPAGSYDIILAPNGNAAVAKVGFERSSPMYVMVSTDWDFSDPGVAPLNSHQSLHMSHPGMKITHFAAPYSFTDPAVPAQRQTELAQWLLMQESKWGDEIGLHIHPYCNFVTHAGMTCIVDQSTVYATDDTGYTIKVGAYGRADFGKLLDHAHELFAQHGLPRPTTFRAGGWTATVETLQALADKGYVADTSALNWPTIAAEWPNSELLRWNMENWSTIGDTSQPYHPSETDAQAPGNIPILEVPDNGTMIDYVTVIEMNAIFDANFMGTALSKPTTLMMGFHPATPGFTEAEYTRVDMFLTYSDMHLASKDTGPVVYANLRDMAKVFK